MRGGIWGRGDGKLADIPARFWEISIQETVAKNKPGEVILGNKKSHDVVLY
jgi:hypothetical protein